MKVILIGKIMELTDIRVCYLARARAMARVVLAQIELQNFAYVTVTFCIPTVKCMTILQPDSEWTVYCWSLYRSHRSLYRPLYSVKTIDIVCRYCSYFLCSYHSVIE